MTPGSVTPRVARMVHASAVLDSAIGRRWAVAYDAAHPAMAWDGQAVDKRVLEAMRVLGVTVPNVYPRGVKNSMPEYERDDAGLWARELALLQAGLIGELARDINARNRTRFVPSIVQVTHAEAAIEWQWRYLSEHAGPRRVYQVWLFCKASGRSFGKAQDTLCRRGVPGWNNDRMVRRARVHASLLIALGLMADGVPSSADAADLGELVPGPGSAPRLDAMPRWWGEARAAAKLLGFGEAEGVICARVRQHEFEGRSFGNQLTMAEYRGRVTVLLRRIKEELRGGD